MWDRSCQRRSERAALFAEIYITVCAITLVVVCVSSWMLGCGLAPPSATVAALIEALLLGVFDPIQRRTSVRPGANPKRIIPGADAAVRRCRSRRFGAMAAPNQTGARHRWSRSLMSPLDLERGRAEQDWRRRRTEPRFRRTARRATTASLLTRRQRYLLDH